MSEGDRSERGRVGAGRRRGSMQARARTLAAALGADERASVRPSTAAAGGGTRPGEAIASYPVWVETDRPQALAALLPLNEPPWLALEGAHGT